MGNNLKAYNRIELRIDYEIVNIYCINCKYFNDKIKVSGPNPWEVHGAKEQTAIKTTRARDEEIYKIVENPKANEKANRCAQRHGVWALRSKAQVAVRKETEYIALV